MSQQPKTPTNQGEGNRTADKEYREAATRHAKEKDTQREGREAEQALEEDDELERAEEAGKSRAKVPPGN